ncbi:MAG: cytochrome c oxidase subunit 3 family protein [Polyangiales bacterium]
MSTPAAALEGQGHDDAHAHGPAFLQHHFDTPAQQLGAAKLGMWLFLAQEVLFFSGLFVAYGVFRAWHPEAFSVASHMLDWKMGGLNTLVLLFSSLTAALAVRSSKLGQRQQTTMYLAVTIVCACIFMVVKYFEYSHKFHIGLLPGSQFNDAEVAKHLPPGITEVPYQVRSFLGIYFMMTGVHGLHVLIGIGVLIWIMMRNIRGEFSPAYNTPVDMAALYWHLVDLIWIYLFPLLYLID